MWCPMRHRLPGALLGLFALLALFAILAAASPVKAQDCPSSTVGFRVMHLADRVVAVWYPTATRPAPYLYTGSFSGLVAIDAAPSRACGQRVPLIVFSHGNTGCGIQSIAFTEELARHGYVVAAPDHADAMVCHTARPVVPIPRTRQPDFDKLDTWNETSFGDRRADVEATIDALLAHGDFHDVIDAENIGAAGHSLGGYTVVGLAGGWTGWLDRRIRAVLGLSPYVMPFQVQERLGNVRIPLMYQGGTLDLGITPFLTGANGAYRKANPPAFFLVLRDADHFAWVNCGNARTTASCLATRETFRLIDDYSIAFFDSYLKHRRAPQLTRKRPELAEFTFKLSP
jgi:predicted dienelactone hydrolase